MNVFFLFFQNMAHVEADDYEKLAYSQRLKAAIHFTVGQICKANAEQGGVEYSPQFMAVLAEAAFKQCESMATDLELFAKHGKRSTINADDVKLFVRKNPVMLQSIEVKSGEYLAQNEVKKGTRKAKKQKTTAASSASAAGTTALTVDEDSNL